MALAGVRGAVRGQHRAAATRRDERAPRPPGLVARGWDGPTGPDQLWVADFSYVWTLAGFCYVAFVVDVFSRRILGWRVSTCKEAGLVVDAFREALQVRHRGEAAWTATGLVHHSDAGAHSVLAVPARIMGHTGCRSAHRLAGRSRRLLADLAGRCRSSRRRALASQAGRRDAP